MCGIAGAVGTVPDRAGAVRTMSATLMHRGPDETGDFDDENCTLGMRRLSIIDVTGGHQPLFNERRNLVCICNGELYNFKTLARELKDLGHVFATGSDVEVALHGYETWGDDVVTRLNGMFALAIWDAPRRRLFLARDRLGKKPLYYTQLRGTLAFASELRTLLTLPGASWSVDLDACRAFCRLGYLPGDRTPITEIRRLPPSHLAVWDDKGLAIRPYWQPDPWLPAATEDVAVDGLLELLRDAVQLRLISDVPLGAFASGGLDSSLVIAVAAGELGARIPTFSITFPGYPDFDEAAHARRVAALFGCEHHEIPVDPSHFDSLTEVVWSLDEPLADPAALPTLLLSREARKEVTVALTGEGADEVFGGYERYSLALRGSALARRLGILPHLAACALRVRGGARYDDSRMSRVLRSAAVGRDNALAWSRAVATSPGLAQAAGWKDDPAVFAPAIQWLPPEGRDGRLRSLQADDLQNMLANGLLTKVDRMTMAASLEARCPFLDYRIVNFGLGLPDAWKIQGRAAKVLLRRLARRLLPREIHTRPKHTFRVPLAEWLRGPLKELAVEAVSSSLLRNALILNQTSIKTVANDHLEGRADFSRALWALITLNVWFMEAKRRVTIEGT
ncbi:MAG TPA: asparagine synthase (glutamine-hydrolyzing) [Gemmatimonadales bacterium]